MTTLTVKIPDGAKARLSNFVKELGGEVIIGKGSTPAKAITKKAKLLAEMEAGLRDVKAIREGKRQPLSMDDLLNGK